MKVRYDVKMSRVEYASLIVSGILNLVLGSWYEGFWPRTPIKVSLLGMSADSEQRGGMNPSRTSHASRHTWPTECYAATA